MPTPREQCRGVKLAKHLHEPLIRRCRGRVMTGDWGYCYQCANDRVRLDSLNAVLADGWEHVVVGVEKASRGRPSAFKGITEWREAGAPGAPTSPIEAASLPVGTDTPTVGTDTPTVKTAAPTQDAPREPGPGGKPVVRGSVKPLPSVYQQHLDSARATLGLPPLRHSAPAKKKQG